MKAQRRTAPIVDRPAIPRARCRDYRGCRIDAIAADRARPRPRARRLSALTTDTPTPCKPPAVSVRLAAELAAGMQRCQDDLERRFVWKARMRIDRNAATVVADRQPIACGELDLDARRMAGDGLVHRVVDHLGGQVMQAAFVGAADIHAGAAADRLQPLENLNILGRIAVGRFGDGWVEKIRHGANIAWDGARASSIRYIWKPRRLYVGTIAGGMLHPARRAADSPELHPAGPGVMVMTMMTNERKIWEAALLLVRRHGAAAAVIAQREAQRLRSERRRVDLCRMVLDRPFDCGIAPPGPGQGRTRSLKPF